jgi:hypothetical protein
MVLIGDVDVMTRPYIVTNINCQVANDSTAPPNQTSVSNTHDRIGQTLLARNHSCREGYMASNHGVSADVDVVLVENCGLREADDAVATKCSEALSTRCVWSDRSMKREPSPSRMS